MAGWGSCCRGIRVVIFFSPGQTGPPKELCICSAATCHWLMIRRARHLSSAASETHQHPAWQRWKAAPAVSVSVSGVITIFQLPPSVFSDSLN